MRRPALAALALLAVVLGVLTACSAEPVAAPAAAPTTTQAAPTTDPLAGFTVTERSFVQGVAAAGFTFNGGNQQAVDLGELICTEIRAERRSTATQQDLSSGGTITPTEAEQLYILAHDNLCSEVPLPNPNSFSTGTYEVGVDIQSGRYRSTGGSDCYWARLGDDQMDIIDNNLSSGPSVFTVQDSDGFIELNRCTWTLAE